MILQLLNNTVYIFKRARYFKGNTDITSIFLILKQKLRKVKIAIKAKKLLKNQKKDMVLSK